MIISQNKQIEDLQTRVSSTSSKQSSFLAKASRWNAYWTFYLIIIMSLLNGLIWIIKFHFQIMAEEEVLYGIGTLAEVKKKMTGKSVAKSHDLNGEMLTELTDTISSGI